jgi:carboxylesterase
MWPPPLLPSAEPFLLPGIRTGCLLVHGITGTPKEKRWLGEALNQPGFTALGWRLNGHAAHKKDLIRSRWEDWIADLQDGWQILTGCADRIYVIGLSIGGILSLLFSASFPVAGVIVLAAPHHLPNDPRLPFLNPISLLWKYRAKNPALWYDAQAKNEHISYDQEPVRALAELRDLIIAMQTALPHITAPALLIYSNNDPTIRAEDQHAELIYQALGSQQKKIIYIENSGHVITRDSARQEVFTAVIDFILLTGGGRI